MGKKPMSKSCNVLGGLQVQIPEKMTMYVLLPGEQDKIEVGTRRLDDT